MNAYVERYNRTVPICIHFLHVRVQYIRDLPGCVRNGKLGADSGPLAAANIRDHCTSGVASKADIQDFSFNFRYVLYSDLQIQAAFGSRHPKANIVAPSNQLD